MRDGISPAAVAVAFLLPLLLSLAAGGPLIGYLKQLRAGQRIRDDGPQRHLEKEGTPTMGGIMIIGTAVAGAAVAAMLIGRSGSMLVWLLLGTAAAYGAIGFADDYLKIRRGRSLGLKARGKLTLQVVAGIALSALLVTGPLAPIQPGQGIGGCCWPLVLFVAFWMVASSNAVNMADGLDGLAGGLSVIAFVGVGTLGLAAGEPDVAVVALALAGACLGFLWFNRHPARLFMGDVGALGLGGALAGLAFAVPSDVIVLLGLALVPFVEAGSVVVQVISFKTTGKRVFKMSPIHHHFELSGWSERRVVWSFWGVGLVAAVATVTYVMWAAP